MTLTIIGFCLMVVSIMAMLLTMNSAFTITVFLGIIFIVID